MAVEGGLNHGLRYGYGCFGQGAGLKWAIEFGGSGAGEPVDFELLGSIELRHDSFVKFGDALLLLVDEGVAED